MRTFRWKSLLDTSLFLVILTIINVAWFHYNPAFRQWPWHPYLLIIALIGLFYGLWEALATVAVCNAVYIIMLAAKGFTVSVLWHTGPDARNLMMFLIGGLVFGEIGEIYQRSVAQAKEESRKVSEKLKQLDSQLNQLRGAHSELQERVRFESTQLADLHEVSDRLMSLKEPEIFESALDLVSKMLGAEDCSVYLWDEQKGCFWRRASKGGGSGAKTANPSQVSPEVVPFQQIRQEPAVLSVRDTWQAGPSPLRWLAAAPLVVQDRLLGVILIESLPLIRLTQQNLKTFSLLADVINRSLENAYSYQQGSRALPSQILAGTVAYEHFRKRLQEDYQLAQRHKTHFSLLHFKIDHFEDEVVRLGQEALEPILEQIAAIVTKNKRTSDLLAYQGDGRFALLLPFTKPEQTYPFIHRVREEARQISTVIQNHFVTINLSFGVTGFDPGITDAQEISSLARNALEQAISKGSGLEESKLS